MNRRTRSFFAWLALGALLGLLIGFLLKPMSEPKELTVQHRKSRQTELHRVPATATLYAALPNLPDTTLEATLASLRNARAAASPNRQRTEFMRKLLALAEDPSLVLEIIQQIQTTDLARSDRSRFLSQIFKQWAGHDPAAAFDALELVDDEHVHRQAMHAVLKVWALSDHEAALAAINASPLKRGEAEGSHIILNALAEIDPDRAIRAAHSLGDEILARNIQHQAVAKKAANDIEAAWAEIDHINDSDLQASLRDAAISGLATEDKEAALSYIDKLSDPSKRQVHLRDIFRDWPLEDAEEALKALANYPQEAIPEGTAFDFGQTMNLAKPQQALNLADALKDEIRNDYLLGVLTEQAIKQPAETAEIAAQYLSNERDLAIVYRHLGEAWAGRDEYAAAEWLSQLPTSTARDEAVASFSNKLFSLDPERAVQWAMSIDSESERATLTQRLLEQWQTLDATAASNWLETSGTQSGNR